jgi:hypothetical protein
MAKALCEKCGEYILLIDVLNHKCEEKNGKST